MYYSDEQKNIGTSISIIPKPNLPIDSTAAQKTLHILIGDCLYSLLNLNHQIWLIHIN
jgi:hypothetical protein